MLAWHRTAVLLVLASSSLSAQLSIENPKKMEVPEEHIQTLFLNTNRVMEAEFHSPGSLENKFRARLVLGQPQERLSIDDADGNASVYLERWDEGKFVFAVMRVGLQRLLDSGRQNRMFDEIARRTRQTPVSAAQLRKEGSPVPALEASRIPDTCVDGMSNSALQSDPCARPRHVPMR
jgi:hypothetical protein